MCCLKMPYDATSMADLVLKIVKGTFIPVPSHYSKEMNMLVKSLLCVDQAKRPSINDILRLPIVKSRIRNFLNDIEYNDEFSHTILHDYNPFKNNKPREKSGNKKDKNEEESKVKTSETEESKNNSNLLKKESNEEIKLKNNQNLIKNAQKPVILDQQKNISPTKQVLTNNNNVSIITQNKNNVSPNRNDEQSKLSEFLKQNNKKVLVTHTNNKSKDSSNSNNSNNINNSSNSNIRKQNDSSEEIYNVHKLLVEMSKIDKDEIAGDQSQTENFDQMKKNIEENLNQQTKEDDYIEYKRDLGSNEFKKLSSDIKSDTHKQESTTDLSANQNSDLSQFQEMEQKLVKEIGEDLYKAVFKIIDQMIPSDSFFYDHEKISKSIIKLSTIPNSSYNINSILICIGKIQEIYSLVIREREINLKKK